MLKHRDQPVGLARGQVNALSRVLKASRRRRGGGTFEITRSLPHRHVAA